MSHTNLVVTVAQEEGSEGREIARQLARLLGLNYLDENILRQVIQNYTQCETEAYIKKLACQGQVLFVNCGANLILQNFPGVVNVLIRAPLSRRVETQMKLEQVPDRAVAYKHLHQADENYAGYIHRYFGPDWTNPDLYDLVINTSRTEPSKLALGISQFIQALSQTAHSAEALRLEEVAV